MNIQDIKSLSSMPLQSPTYPRGPYHFSQRQYLICSYQTEPDAIRQALPEPLEPVGQTVSVQWLDLPDGEGFGAYSATAQIILCRLGDEVCNFVSQMYVDNNSALAGGREIWGYPMKFAQAKLRVQGDTLTGTLVYGGQTTAIGTMVYKHDAFSHNADLDRDLFSRRQLTLKLIPDVDGKLAIAQLVGLTFGDVVLKGAWSGPARLNLMPAVNCPLADLPVLGETTGRHVVIDMTLPYGQVVHDYLAG
jgi:acetoacetate decarboxylase